LIVQKSSVEWLVVLQNEIQKAAQNWFSGYQPLAPYKQIATKLINFAILDKKTYFFVST